MTPAEAADVNLMRKCEVATVRHRIDVAPQPLFQPGVRPTPIMSRPVEKLYCHPPAKPHTLIGSGPFVA